MKILTLNCGSSSVKYALFDMPKKIRLCHGIVNRINLGRSFIEHYNHDSQKYIYDHECPNHTIAIKLVTDLLVSQENGVISSLFDIDAVGHRVVHGGQEFTKPVIINKEIERKIEKYSSLAPLHNPVNLAGIRATMQLMPNIPNAAVFDTAFFTTLPAHVYIYGLPYEWYVKYGIRKYGFHGTSHRYVSRRVAILLGKKPQEINIITLHIGNGVSVTAVKAGEAYDHSMGFTPLEGAIMGTRCGDIDPAIPLYIMKQEKLDCDDMEDILNNKSGLLGISGQFTDRRDILHAMKTGEERAKLSFDIECYRLRKYIGAYSAVLGRVDAIAFTAGVGENSFLHRAKICEGLESMGVSIDSRKNKQAIGGAKEMEINSINSPVKVFVIPTNEELVFAKEVFALLDDSNDSAK